MKLSLILAVLFFASYAFAAPQVAYVGNVSVVGHSDDWSYRNSQLFAWSLLDSNGAYFFSLSAGGTKHNAQGDAIWGAAYTVPNNPPTVWLAYWSAVKTFSEGSDFSKLDVNAAAGYIANAYVALIEKSPNGTVVAGRALKEGFLNEGVDWDISSQQINKELKWVTFTGKVSGEPWEASLMFVVSDVVGVINQANASVSPKSLESIVEIKNWPYKSAENTLTLVMVVATGASSAKGNAVVAGSGASKVFFALAKKAIIAGKVEDVMISHYQEVDYSAVYNDDNVKAQLNGKYKSGGKVQIVNVTFPAGASHILYDPSIGAGDPVTEPATDAAATVTASLLAMIALLLVALF